MRKLAFVAGLIFLAACSKEKKITPDTFLVTTLRVYTEDFSDTTARDTFEFIDYDAIGANPAYKTDTIRLAANHHYKVMIQPCNDVQLPHIDYSPVITEAARNYFMVGIPQPFNLMTTKILDKDSDNLPLGLHQEWTTGAASSGSYSLKLRYQPGIKNGTETPGISDAETVFPLIIF
ncbi:MAG: hypothetical protein U0T73_01005 [Chitinophagales bacterium]